MHLLTNSTRKTGTSYSSNIPRVDPSLPLTIAHWRHGDTEVAIGGDDTAGVVLVLSEGQTVERFQGGVWSHRPSRLGNITVTDPEEVTKFAMRGQSNVVKLFMPMANLAAAAGLSRHPHVIPRFGDPEPELGRCAQRALVALHEGDGSDPLLLSSIAMRLSMRLTEQPSFGSNRAIGGLAPWQLRRVEELIEARASAPIASSPSLSELAAEVDLSLHHFAREFRRTTGVTPYAYMLRRRLDRARQLIIHSRLSLARIGILTGFPSAAHFTSRFHREMGVPPGALRRAAQR